MNGCKIDTYLGFVQLEVWLTLGFDGWVDAVLFDGLLPQKVWGVGSLSQSADSAQN